MTTEEKIQVLEQLSALDLEIAEVDKKLDIERSTLASQKNQLEQLRVNIEKYAAALLEIGQTRSQLATEVRQLSTQVDKSREKMNRARNERETNAATREFEDLKRIQRDREEEIGRIQLLEAGTLEKSEAAKEESEKLKEQLNASEGKANGRIRQLESKKKAHLETRSKLTGRLPRRLVSRYEMIRKRRGVAVALANGGLCSACHMALPPQLYQKMLRSHDIESCPSCRRLLFIKPQHDEEAASEA